MKRNIYLKTIPPAEAVARVKASIDREALIREETIPSHEASGRVLAHAVHARYSSPTFHSAAMVTRSTPVRPSRHGKGTR